MAEGSLALLSDYTITLNCEASTFISLICSAPVILLVLSGCDQGRRDPGEQSGGHCR